MLNVEDWAEIRRLRRAEQMPIAEIARVMGISRNTVRAVFVDLGRLRQELDSGYSIDQAPSCPPVIRDSGSLPLIVGLRAVAFAGRA